jgi:hypothetical protein
MQGRQNFTAQLFYQKYSQGNTFVIQNRPSKTKFNPQLADKFLQNFHADIKKTAPK